MQTPWGPLESLDLKDHDKAIEILATDKHQLLEGLVVERLFDQIFSADSTQDQQITSLNVESYIVDTGRKENRWLAIVWARKIEPGLGRYLQALEKNFEVCLITYHENPAEFMAVPVHDGQRNGESRPVQDFMRALSGGKQKTFKVAENVRDKKRQQQAFWGFLSESYGDMLGSQVVLSRLLINYGIQPYFRNVWNLDRIFIVGDDIWLFEIKHKYPMAGKQLTFGINDGELNVLDRLVQCGIRCLHTIVVKPVWSKDTGSMYLFNDLNMRERAAVIGLSLTTENIVLIKTHRAETAGKHTSVTGSSSLFYRKILAEQFQFIGLLVDSAKSMKTNIFYLMKGDKRKFVSDLFLRELCISKK